ncbi:MAG: nucleotidyltransferase family protein [Chitinivibrionales bacterium]|nr:nucleotidyltransferase family protein [Chitinivibrionales bacterium]
MVVSGNKELRWFLTQELAREALLVLDSHFTTLQLRYMPVKGAYLINSGLAAAMKNRRMCDIDILVDERDLSRATDYFCKLEGFFLQEHCDNNYINAKSQIIMNVQTLEITVEIQCCMNSPGRYHLPVQELFQRSSQSSTYRLIPSVEDSLLIFLCHFQQHIVFEFPATTFEEMHLLIEQHGFSWQRFWALAAATKIERFLSYMVSLYRTCHPETPPPPRRFFYPRMLQRFIAIEKHHQFAQWQRRIIFDVPFMASPFSLISGKLRNLTIGSAPPYPVDSGKPKPNKTFSGRLTTTARSFFTYLPVIKELFIISRYDNTFLTRYGVLETALAAIMGIAWWGILHWMQFLRSETTGYPYIVYILVGTQVWAYCMALHNGVAAIYQRYKLIIWQWKTPPEILLIYLMVSISLRFLVNFLIIILFMRGCGIALHLHQCLFFLLIVPLILLFSATGLLNAISSVVWSMSSRMIQSLFSILFILTPIVYPLQSVRHPVLKILLTFNPLTHLVGSCRDWILSGRMESWPLYLVSSVVAILGFMVIVNFWYAAQGTVNERLYL